MPQHRHRHARVHVERVVLEPFVAGIEACEDPEAPALLEVAASAADDLQSETILVDPFVLVVAPDHAWARRRGVRWQELADRPLVLLDHSSGSRRLIDDALRAHGVVPRVAQQLGHPTTVFRMIEAGIGIGVMPALAAPPRGLASSTPTGSGCACSPSMPRPTGSPTTW